jgi:hypothetical protein
MNLGRNRAVLWLSIAFLSLWACRGEAEDVAKWSVKEITLAARGTYAYTDEGVTATFTGPSGIQKMVHGFWDGGSTWRIRFAPTREGAWSYTTTSSDAGLNGKTGGFTCVAPKAGNHGFLRRDSNNRTSFVWDDGSRYFMWGQTYYDVMLNVQANGGWKTAVDNSLANGMNKIRFHVYPLRSYGSGIEDTTYPQTIPYGGTSSSPNRDQLNNSFWQGLDAYVKYLESKGVVADLILFNTYVPQGALQWGTQAQDERFLRYALARYAAFHNVIWCVSNEWAVSGKAQSYIDILGSIVRNDDPWIAEGSFLRPLSVHQNTGVAFQFFGSNWPVHASVQFGVRNKTYANGDEWSNASITSNLGHSMPVVNDEYGYIGEKTPINLTRTQHRSCIWGIATSGGYGSAGDYPRISTGNPEISGDWSEAAEYGDIKRLVDFFTTKGIQYWRMSSQNALRTSGTRVYVLAESGQQYVIYAAVGGNFSVDLAAGSYDAWRFDPRTGAETSLGTVAGGGSSPFEMPDSQDWVVRLARRIVESPANLRLVP